VDRTEQLQLPLELLPGWLFGISASRVRGDVQPKITQYRRECFKVLWRAFQGEALAAVGQHEIQRRPASELVHIRQMGLAIAQMAEQQIALEARVSVHDQRLDRAVQVFRAFEHRLDVMEEQLQPSTYITDAQAAEIASLVKAIAQHLSERDKSKNHYQSVFGELYRRFHVSTYKHVRQAQYAEVLAFLDEWRRSAKPA
jgi:superfamily II RNA helicase